MPSLRSFQNLLSQIFEKSLLVTAVIFLLLALMGIQIHNWYRERLIREQRADARVELALLGNGLSGAIDRRINLVEGLKSFLVSESTSSEFALKFEAFAAGLYSSTDGVQSIILAPSGIVDYVYPPEARENLLGDNLLEQISREIRDDIQRAIDSRNVVLSGPIQLPNGGKSIIAFQAVYQQDDHFWGLVSVIFDLSPILNRAGLNIEADTVGLAIMDQGNHLLYGNNQFLGQEPVNFRLYLPEGYWELAMVPQNGWGNLVKNAMLLFDAFGILVILLTTVIAYFSISNQSRLRQAIKIRTQEIQNINQQLEADIAQRKIMQTQIEEREEQYRAIYNSVRDALIITDLDGNIVDFNPAAIRMYGYEEAEFRQLRLEDLLLPESHPHQEHYLAKVKAGKQFRGRVIQHDKNGTTFHSDMLGTGFAYRGKPHGLAVLRDVTEEVRAFQLLEERVEDRTHELQTLLEVSRDVASNLDLDSVLSVVFKQLERVVGFTSLTLAIVQDEQYLAVLRYQGTNPDSDMIGWNDQRNYPSEKLIRLKEPIVIADMRSGSRELLDWQIPLYRHTESQPSTLSSMVVPLLVKNKTIGLLFFGHTEPHYYTIKDADFAQALAYQSAVAIENARLYERAQEIAALEERQKLAQELHDSVSQALYSISLGAHTANLMIESDDIDKKQLRQPLEYLLSLAKAGLAEMRALIFELRPESLEQEGLNAALSKQIAALEASHKLDIQQNLSEEPNVSLDIKHALYRIAQEAFHNIVKHAKASQVRVFMQKTSQDTLVLEIEDNGVGFDPQASFPGHLGLRSMKERVSQLGGELQIDSEIQRGTLIRAEIPIS